MFCLECYRSVDFVIDEQYAVSLSDGNLYRAHCPLCNAKTELSQNQIASNVRSKISQELYLEKCENCKLKPFVEIDNIGRKRKQYRYAYFQTKDNERK